MTVINFGKIEQEARDKRDARVAALLRDIIGANKDYLNQLDALSKLRSLDEKAPEVYPVRLDLTKFESWKELQSFSAETTTHIGKIRSVLPAPNEPFQLKDIKRRFGEQYPGVTIKEDAWPVHFGRIVKNGEVVKIGEERAGSSLSGIYAVSGSIIDNAPREKSHPQVAWDVLRERGEPMDLDEIVKEIQRRGLGGTGNQYTLRENVMRGMRRQKHRFVETSTGRWKAINKPAARRNPGGRRKQGQRPVQDRSTNVGTTAAIMEFLATHPESSSTHIIQSISGLIPTVALRDIGTTLAVLARRGKLVMTKKNGRNHYAMPKAVEKSA